MDVLNVVAFVIALIAHIMLLITAFKKAFVWGIFCLFFPVIILLFIAIYFRECVRPLILYGISIAILLINAGVLGG